MAAVLAIAVAVSAVSAHAVPKRLSVSGTLTSSPATAVPDGAYDLKFALYASESGGTAVWTESAVTVGVKSGLFVTQLGEKTPIEPQVVAADGLWLGVKVAEEPELPRRPLASAVFALRAGVAEGVDCSACIGLQQLAADVLAPFAKDADLATVAKSGMYSDLNGAPKLADVATSGVYADLSGVPQLGKVATSNQYADLSGLPQLGKVATSNQYADLSGLPQLGKVATSNDYADLSGLPVLAKTGSQCGSGLVVTGLGADGSLQCAAGYDPSQFQFAVAQVAPKACNPATLGAAYVDPAGPTLRICNGASWHPIALAAIGTQSSPGKSCKAILASQPASKDGIYWVDAFGKGAAQVWCDMTSDGGGWTLPLWFGSDSKVIRYYDFVQKKNFDFKKLQQLAINAAAIDPDKGLNLNNLGPIGVALPLQAGNLVVVKMRREYGLSGAGMVMHTTGGQNDDGLTLYDDFIGTRTHGTGYQLRGNKLSAVLPDSQSSHAFAMVINGDGVVLHTATSTLGVTTSGSGGSYDSCTIDALHLGTNGSNYDPWKSGNLYLERIAVFNGGVAPATIQAYVQQMGVF
jgi:hypothetical protein